MIIRELERHELEAVWTIDRSEQIVGIYHHRASESNLVLMRERQVVKGWPPGEREHYGPILLDCFDRGGDCFGAFDDATLVGVAVLENRFIGPEKDRLQLVFLHVSRSQRRTGLGRALFDRAADRARARGARQLYVSATPSENTVDFYLRRGCRVSSEVDPALFEREPEDIHLEFDLAV